MLKPQPTEDATADELLARRVRLDADHAAFETLVGRHSKNLLSRAASLLGPDEALRLDAVQQTWAEAWRSRSKFNDEQPTHYRRWLYTTLRRRCLDIRRKRKRTDAETLLAEPAAKERRSSAEIAVWKEQLQSLERCLADLSELQACVVRATLGGQKASGAAEQCGCTSEQASRELYRAKQKLIACVEAQDS